MSSHHPSWRTLMSYLVLSRNGEQSFNQLLHRDLDPDHWAAYILLLAQKNQSSEQSFSSYACGHTNRQNNRPTCTTLALFSGSTGNLLDIPRDWKDRGKIHLFCPLLLRLSQFHFQLQFATRTVTYVLNLGPVSTMKVSQCHVLNHSVRLANRPAFGGTIPIFY